jgi:hypothetical protein
MQIPYHAERSAITRKDLVKPFTFNVLDTRLRLETMPRVRRTVPIYFQQMAILYLMAVVINRKFGSDQLFLRWSSNPSFAPISPGSSELHSVSTPRPPIQEVHTWAILDRYNGEFPTSIEAQRECAAHWPPVVQDLIVREKDVTSRGVIEL